MEQLIKQRALIKSAITRIKNYCIIEEATEVGMRARGQKVDEYFAKFELIQSSIEEETKSEDQENEEQYRTETENSYYFIKELCIKEREVNRTIIDESLPTNSEMSADVKGDALPLIKHPELSDSNYTIAWDLIKRKYDVSRQIKQKKFQLLFDQPVMKGPFYNDLKTMLNNTHQCINSLKALNEPVDQWDSLLLFHLERKLDNESQTLWLRAAVDSPTYAQFIEFMERRLRELENCKLNKLTVTQPTYKQNAQQRIHLASIKKCPACQQTHLLFACSKFKSLNINDRIKMVKSNNICFNCLQYDHIAADCTKSVCKLYKGRHNTLLHRQQNQDQNHNREQEGPLETNEVTIHTACTKNNEKVTLLATAVVMILGGNNQYYPCRILLDVFRGST